MAKTLKRPRAFAEPTPTLAEAVASVTRAVEKDGVILRSAFAKLGVPRALAADVSTRLAAAGFEVTPKLARVPLARQIERQLGGSALLALRSIESYVRGASKREAVAAAGELTASGRARLIVRSKELFLASPDAGGLDDREVDALESAITTLTAALKLARRKGGTLLRADVEEALRPVRRPASAPVRATPAMSAPTARPGSLITQDVGASIDAHREATGLTWVPRLVRALGGVAVLDAVHAELLRGARAGRFELRPESGMGRLSEDDAALCLAGPQGSRLSWVRRIEEKS